MPPAPPAPPAYPATATYPAPPTAPPAARSAGNPLAGVTVRDVVLDVLALVLLLTSLALPWDVSSSSGIAGSSGWNDVHDRWWAVLSLVIAVFGIAVPYLGATRAVPGLTRQLCLLVKLLTVAPAAVSIFCLVLFECIHVTNDDKGGIGAGGVMLLLGALLVLVPRTFDDLPGLHRGARAAGSVLYALAAVAVVGSVAANVIRVFTTDDLSGFAQGWTRAVVALAMVVFALPVLVVSIASVRSGSVWTPVAAALLAAYLFTSFSNETRSSSDLPTFFSIGGEKLSLSGIDSYLIGAIGVGGIGASALLLAAATALLAGRWHAAEQTVEQRAAWWVRVASTAGFFAAGVGALLLVHNTAVYVISKANHGHSHVNGTWIACMVLLAVTTVLAGLTGLFAQRFAQQKVLPVAVAGAWFFLGFVLAIVTSTADRLSLGASILTPMTMPEVCAVLFVPLLVLGALTVPTAVRRTYGPVISLAQINAAGH